MNENIKLKAQLRDLNKEEIMSIVELFDKKGWAIDDEIKIEKRIFSEPGFEWVAIYESYTVKVDNGKLVRED